eukprot:2622346-Amphidinium_carterae.1
MAIRACQLKLLPQTETSAQSVGSKVKMVSVLDQSEAEIHMLTNDTVPKHRLTQTESRRPSKFHRLAGLLMWTSLCLHLAAAGFFCRLRSAGHLMSPKLNTLARTVNKSLIFMTF